MEHKHTRGPYKWHYSDNGMIIGAPAKDGHFAGHHFATVPFSRKDIKQSAVDAEFIVRACNSHYELVEALELVLLTVDFSGSSLEASIRSKLAKAKVE